MNSHPAVKQELIQAGATWVETNFGVEVCYTKPPLAVALRT